MRLEEPAKGFIVPAHDFNELPQPLLSLGGVASAEGGIGHGVDAAKVVSIALGLEPGTQSRIADNGVGVVHAGEGKGLSHGDNGHRLVLRARQGCQQGHGLRPVDHVGENLVTEHRRAALPGNLQHLLQGFPPQNAPGGIVGVAENEQPVFRQLLC